MVEPLSAAGTAVLSKENDLFVLYNIVPHHKDCLIWFSPRSRN